MAEDRNTLRDKAYAALEAMAEQPVPRLWRAVVTDTESLTGYGPVCPSAGAHPLLDGDMGRDTDGVYDCCPHVVETFSEPLAAFTVAVLNYDARMHPRPVRCNAVNPHYSHDFTRDGEPLHCPGDPGARVTGTVTYSEGSRREQ